MCRRERKAAVETKGTYLISEFSGLELQASCRGEFPVEHLDALASGGVASIASRGWRTLVPLRRKRQSVFKVTAKGVDDDRHAVATGRRTEPLPLNHHEVRNSGCRVEGKDTKYPSGPTKPLLSTLLLWT